MKSCRIGVGTQFKWNGRRLEITKEEEKDIFLAMDLDFDNVIERIALTDMLDHLTLGSLEILVRNHSEKSVPNFIDFSSIDEEQKDIAKQRYEAIKPLLALEVKSINPYVESRKEQLKETGQDVSRATLYRWLKAFKESDDGVLSLVSNSVKSGPRQKKLDKEVEMIIDRVVRENYLVREETTKKTICELVRNEINKKNDKRYYEPKLKYPSESTVLRRINELDLYEVEKSRKGANAIRNKFKQVKYNEKPTYPLQRVECDHTVLDIIVVDDKSLLPIGRPTITTLLDVFTGYPLGVYIGFEPPSYAAVMQALLHAITPKSYLKNKEKFGNIDNEWVAYGLPELLVVDNGKEFLSKHFDEACLQLGIETYHCPVMMPWYKGAIERHFRTMNIQFLHHAPGTTFSNIFKKGDYDAKKNASIRYSKLVEMFHKWLIDYYAIEYNNGVRGVPANLWNTHFEHAPRPAVPSSMLDWKIALMKVGYGSIQRTGIRRVYLFYHSKELDVVKRKLLMKGKIAKVKYKYDPTDLSKIYVFDGMNKKYIEVPCTNQNYTEGLNEYAHRVIVYEKITKEKKKVDKNALAAAKASLVEMMQEEKNFSMKERKKMKRIEGIGTDNILTIEPPKPSIKEVKVPKVVKANKQEEVSDVTNINFEDWEDYDGN